MSIFYYVTYSMEYLREKLVHEFCFGGITNVQRLAFRFTFHLILRHNP